MKSESVKWHSWYHLLVLFQMVREGYISVSVRDYYMHVQSDTQILPPYFEGLIPTFKKLSLKRISNDFGKLYRMGFLSRKRIPREVMYNGKRVTKGYEYSYSLTNNGVNYMYYKSKEIWKGSIKNESRAKNWSYYPAALGCYKKKVIELQRTLERKERLIEETASVFREYKQENEGLQSEVARLRAEVKELREYKENAEIVISLLKEIVVKVANGRT
ncbi:MAG: hypothetical protein GXO25_07280, partial [Euryarchaeota archaeon]|nr:hypothetical protein [Euryarchaeota archaeon]